MSHRNVSGKHRVHTSSVPAEGRLQCSDGGRSAHANVDRQAENTMTAHVKKEGSAKSGIALLRSSNCAHLQAREARRPRFSANRSLQICSQSLQCMYLARRGSRKHRSTPCSPVASPCSQQTDPHIPTSETNIFGTEGARLSDGTADRKEWVCIDVRHIRTHTQTRSPDQIDKNYHMFRQKTPKMGTRDCLRCKVV